MDTGEGGGGSASRSTSNGGSGGGSGYPTTATLTAGADTTPGNRADPNSIFPAGVGSAAYTSSNAGLPIVTW